MKMPYQVTVFDIIDNPQSKHCYRNLFAARAKFKDFVTSAPCANTGRVLLSRVEFGRGPQFWGPNFDKIDEWVQSSPEPDFQVAGYIVHSARSVNGNASRCQSVNKEFYRTKAEAVRKARQLADKWSPNHEGLIVFKAVMHVQKHEAPPRSPRARIIVTDIE
ncbi:MAG: hypothetical protein V3S12_01265 [Acidiferrobacterales bacterium]